MINRSWKRAKNRDFTCLLSDHGAKFCHQHASGTFAQKSLFHMRYPLGSTSSIRRRFDDKLSNRRNNFFCCRQLLKCLQMIYFDISANLTKSIAYFNLSYLRRIFVETTTSCLHCRFDVDSLKYDTTSFHETDSTSIRQLYFFFEYDSYCWHLSLA